MNRPSVLFNKDMYFILIYIIFFKLFFWRSRRDSNPYLAPWQGGIVTIQPRDQLKSVKGTSYLRPRILVRPNFTNRVICNSTDCQVTTFTEPFTAFSILPRQYRTRTCDPRLYADALTNWANRREYYYLPLFSFVEKMRIELTTDCLQSILACLGTCFPINEKNKSSVLTTGLDFTDGLFPITCYVAT